MVFCRDRTQLNASEPQPTIRAESSDDVAAHENFPHLVVGVVVRCLERVGALGQPLQICKEGAIDERCRGD